MSSTATVIRGHGASRVSHTSLRDIAGTARVYLLDEQAMTWDEVMEARGWDRRHRRYRRRSRP